MKRYRIMYDNYSGYEAQVWSLWRPYWRMIGTNTFRSIEDAEAFIHRSHNPVAKYIGKI